MTPQPTHTPTPHDHDSYVSSKDSCVACQTGKPVCEVHNCKEQGAGILLWKKTGLSIRVCAIHKTPPTEQAIFQPWSAPDFRPVLRGDWSNV